MSAARSSVAALLDAEEADVARFRSDLTSIIMSCKAAIKAGDKAALREAFFHGGIIVAGYRDGAFQSGIDLLEGVDLDNVLTPEERTAAIGKGRKIGEEFKAENAELDRKIANIDGRPVSLKLKPLELSEFLALNIPPREMLLAPILPEKGLAMLYAARGVGKTRVALGIAFAVATGGKFLKWTSLKPRRVLCIDGELPGSELQSRLHEIVTGEQQRHRERIPHRGEDAGEDVDGQDLGSKPAPGMFNVLSADVVPDGIGNLADPKVQNALDPWLDGIELLILDNLSSLTAVIRDNDAESWTPIQEWLLRLRRRGISVLIVHHAGKDGAQRGTSRREDVLDTSMSLRQPGDYVQADGARFEIHFEKHRGFHGNDACPFEARMEIRNCGCLWTMRAIEDVNLARVAALADDNMSVRDIADETGIPKSTVHRLKKRAAENKRQPGDA